MNKYLIGAIVWALIIMVLTLTPGEAVPDVSLFDYDKLGHGFIFFVLSFLLIKGTYENLQTTSRAGNAVLIGVVTSAFYGFLIEIIQSFIPGRSMDVYDAVANVIGSILGLSLFYLLNKLRA